MNKKTKMIGIACAATLALLSVILCIALIYNSQKEQKARIAFEDKCGIQLPKSARIKRFYKNENGYMAFEIDLDQEAKTQLEYAFTDDISWGREDIRRDLLSDSFIGESRNFFLRDLGWLNTKGVSFDFGFETLYEGVVAKTGIWTVIFMKYDNSGDYKLITSWYL
jgi:hypothetical protein